MINLSFDTYDNANLPKKPLSELVSVFKGKKFSGQVDGGNISVINLSQMGEEGIDYDHLGKIEGNERDFLKYFLEVDDVLIASKGTVKKVAVFEKDMPLTVASANITVLRPLGEVTGFYIKLFLDSDVGQFLLEEANTGKNVLNINTQKLMAIEIPIIPKVKQQYLVQKYLLGRNTYLQKMARAHQEWDWVKKDIRKNLF